MLRERVFTSHLGAESVSSESWGDQSSDPAHITAVTWTAGDMLAQVKICSSVPHSHFFLPPFHVSCRLLWRWNTGREELVFSQPFPSIDASSSTSVKTKQNEREVA